MHKSEKFNPTLRSLIRGRVNALFKLIQSVPCPPGDSPKMSDHLKLLIFLISQKKNKTILFSLTLTPFIEYLCDACLHLSSTTYELRIKAIDTFIVQVLIKQEIKVTLSELFIRVY